MEGGREPCNILAASILRAWPASCMSPILLCAGPMRTLAHLHPAARPFFPATLFTFKTFLAPDPSARSCSLEGPMRTLLRTSRFALAVSAWPSVIPDVSEVREFAAPLCAESKVPCMARCCGRGVQRLRWSGLTWSRRVQRDHGTQFLLCSRRTPATEKTTAEGGCATRKRERMGKVLPFSALSVSLWPSRFFWAREENLRPHGGCGGGGAD